MKRPLLALLTLMMVVGFSFNTTQVEAASSKAVSSAKVVKFANCTEMNKVYKGGVARSASVKNKGGKTKIKPFVSKALYDANSKSDRDRDSIACER